MGKVKELEAFIAKHNHHISPIVLSVTVVAVLGLVCPTLLLAQESSTTTQFRFQKPPAAAPGTRFLGPPISASSSEWQEGSYSGIRAISSSTWTPSPEIMSKLGDYQKTIGDIQGLMQKIKGQGLPVPSATASNTVKAGALIDYINKIKSVGGTTTSPIELPAMIQSLQNDKEVLNKLAAWKGTQTQAQTDLNGIVAKLGVDKAITDKLTKNGFNVKSMFTQFSTDTAQLKAMLDRAKKNVKANPAAIKDFQAQFGDKLDAVKIEDRTISDMSKIVGVTGTYKAQSIRGVSTSFKNIIAEMQKKITDLKAKGGDTTEAEAKLGEIQAKQTEILNLLSSQNPSKEAVVADFKELVPLRTDFMKNIKTVIQSIVPVRAQTSTPVVGGTAPSTDQTSSVQQ